MQAYTPWGSLTHPTRKPVLAFRLVCSVGIARQGPHKIEHGPAHTRVGDPDKRLVQLKTLAAAKKFNDIAFSWLFRETMFQRTAWSLFVEKLYGDTEHLSQIVQAPRADTIHPFFVLLHLLKGEPQLLAELFLAHAKQHPPQAHPRAHVNIHGVGATGIVLVRLTCRWAFSPVVYFFCQVAALQSFDALHQAKPWQAKNFCGHLIVIIRQIEQMAWNFESIIFII